MGSVLHSKNPAEGVQSAVKIRPLANTHHELEPLRAASRVIPSLVSPRDFNAGHPVFANRLGKIWLHLFAVTRGRLCFLQSIRSLSYYEIRVQPDCGQL
jgi:hypothetical protein